MVSIYKTSYIYIIIFYEVHISKKFVGCHYHIVIQLVFQVLRFLIALIEKKSNAFFLRKRFVDA